jgi:hypothetical protein
VRTSVVAVRPVDVVVLKVRSHPDTAFAHFGEDEADGNAERLFDLDGGSCCMVDFWGEAIDIFA